MKSKKITQEIVILKLEENEAKWLKDLVQNPIGCEPDEEDKDSKEIRKKFWDAL